MRRVHVLVSGRVQGVFYRSTCAEIARKAGLAGWVRNRPDGRVEAVFQGASDVVERMLTWCREGPPLAVVTSVEVTEEAERPEPGFRVTG